MSTFIDNHLALSVLAPTALALLAILITGYLLIVLRRYRRDQKVILGEGRDRDIIAHARAVQQNVDSLGADIRTLAANLDETGKRLNDCFTHRSVIRYDAYNDLSGMQSTTVALLDAKFSGIILSSIQSRDHARIYVKEVRHGDSKEKLSPEEVQVLKEAMGLKPHKLAGLGSGGSDE